MHAFLTWPGPVPMAHRGGAGLPGHEGLENSLAAFTAATRLGYTYLETDVHATADGVVLACHDHTLDRTTDRRGRICDLPYSVVREARVAGRYPVPRLDELLAALPHARLNIDAKHSGVVRPLIEVIEATGCQDRICLASFSDRRLRELRQALGTEVCTSFGPRGSVVTALIAALPRAGQGQPTPRPVERLVEQFVERLSRLLPEGVPVAQLPDVFAGRPRLLERTVTLLHSRGTALHVWTVDDPQRMEALLDAGADGLITDRPDLLREVLERRGQWHQLPGDEALGAEAER